MRPVSELLNAPAWQTVSALIESPGAGRSVAFDADGTLWRGDVGEDLLRYLATEDLLPEHRGSRGLFAEYEQRLEPEPANGFSFAVEVMAGFEEQALCTICRDFFERRFLGRLFPFVRPLVTELMTCGYELWVVSASPVWAVEAGAEALGIPPSHVIGVRSTIESGRLTHKIESPVPCGEGKVKALAQRGIRPALAVGNGDLDLPMLDYSDRALVVAPYGDMGNSLVQVATERGWAIQRG